METKEQSIDVPDLILSHQYWASEGVLVVWRQNKEHRYSQTRSIKKIFANYHIRVGPKFGPGVDKARAKSCLASKVSSKMSFYIADVW